MSVRAKTLELLSKATGTSVEELAVSDIKDLDSLSFLAAQIYIEDAFNINLDIDIMLGMKTVDELVSRVVLEASRSGVGVWNSRADVVLR